MDKHILRLILKILLPASGWFLLCFFGPRCLKFFMPFVIGWLISMLANPLVRFLERKLCLVRKHSSMVIVAGALALVIGLIYLAVSNGARLLWSFMKDLPDLYAGIEAEVQESLTHLENLFTYAPAGIRTGWEKLGNNLNLTYVETIIEESEKPQNVEIVEPDQEQTYEEQQSDVEGQGKKESPQMNFTFNVTGNNNSFYNHVDTVNNYYGGKKDGK